MVCSCSCSRLNKDPYLRRLYHTVTRRQSILILLLALATVVSSKGWAQAWGAEGPGPNRHGQVENIRDGEVIGAIRAVAAHPENSNVVYVGTVNGGIWKTSNATSAAPNWKHQTDDKESMSIGALEFDPTDSSRQTLVAGIGRFSSFGDGGPLIGVIRTTDGGKSWKIISGGRALRGLNISGVAPRGKIIVVSVNDADDISRVGIWRTINGGQSWNQASGHPETGLPTGRAACVTSTPGNRKQLFTDAGASGLFRSDDTGQTWAKISDASLDSLMADADNVKIAVGRAGNVYVAVDVKGMLTGIFHSQNSGMTWQAMDLPGTDDGGINPGKQGGNHLSILADIKNPNVVYIGGDRQPSLFVDGRESDPPSWPNLIGAWTYSGRLFRGDVLKPDGKQWVHLTHSKRLGPDGGGTSSGSAPHADSRAMAISADGNLIEVDDGGIYRRTKPQTNDGDWFSMNGNIQATEFHAVAWDGNSHVAVGGAQDTGTPAQWPRSAVPWQSISTSDGGVVAVDSLSSPGYSLRYSSCYSLLNFRRQVWDSTNVIQSEEFPQLAVLNDGAALQPQFYTPIRVNAVMPNRLVIGAANSVYESLDQGNTVTEIGPGVTANDTGSNSLAYGSNDNPDILYVASGAQVFVRVTGVSPSLTASSTYSGGYVVGIALDLNRSATAFVVSPTEIFRTADAGVSAWTNITGDLPSLVSGAFRSIAYDADNSIVMVGTNNGVFASKAPDFSRWSRMGSGLPNAPVYQIEYNPQDKVYIAGTLGRGAWTLRAHTGVTRPKTKISAKDVFNLQVQQAMRESSLFDAPKTTPTLPDKSDPKSFELGPGVVVDSGQHRIYAMSVDSGVNAVDTSTGKRVWSTKVAAKPIGLAANHVICQAVSAGKENTLRIVVLNSETGETISAGTLALPQNVIPSVRETMKGNFVAAADGANDSAVISWRFVKRPERGLPPHTKPTLPNTSDIQPDMALAAPSTGAFRMNLVTGATSPIEAADINSAQTEQERRLKLNAGISTLGHNQFISRDLRSFIVTQEVTPNTQPKKYTLTVYDRATNARLGELQSRFSAFSFFIDESRIVYIASSYAERVGQGLSFRHRRIIATDLVSGLDIWSLEVPDLAYHGSFPP